MRPYLSLDIETTGLSIEKSEVLEVGFIADTFSGPINKLPSYNILVALHTIAYAEPYALVMNHSILAEIVNQDSKVVKHSVEDTFKAFRNAVLWLSEVSHDYDVKQGLKYPSKKITIAGKNVASFDLPILKNFFLRHGIDPEQVKSVFDLIGNRTLDVGSMYFSKFGYIPSLSEINAITDRQVVSHRAVEDATDVVCAVRSIMGVNYDGTSGR